MAKTFGYREGKRVELCRECGAPKHVDEPCPEEGTLSHEPVRLRTLPRPIVAGRYSTIDWDELTELAERADRGGRMVADPENFDWEVGYAQGVRDALRWLAVGAPTPELLNLLGE